MSLDVDSKSEGRLDRWIKRADFLGKVVTPLGILIGGWWAYDNFHTEKTHGQTLTVSIGASQVEFDAGQVLLSVDIKLNNVGRVPVSVSRLKDKIETRGEGCELSIRRYKMLSSSGSPVVLLNWREGPGNWSSEEVIDKYNVLKGSPAFEGGNYVINPGLEVHERTSVMLSKGFVYAVRARFWHGGGSMSDLIYVYVK